MYNAHSIVLGVIGMILVGACEQEDRTLGIPPKQCSSGNAVAAQESAWMEPGGDCIGCHASGEGPSFLVAGTVMGALPDDTNCAGVAGVTVRLTGADGNLIELTTNESGNFFSRLSNAALVFPYHAEISRNGVTIQMASPRTATETSCNACHTPSGANGAPGRIVAP